MIWKLPDKFRSYGNAKWALENRKNIPRHLVSTGRVGYPPFYPSSLSSGPKLNKSLKGIFKASALWADAFYRLICPSVCVFVRLSVCLSVHF